MLGEILNRKVFQAAVSLVVIAAFAVNSATMCYASGAGSLRTTSTLKDGGRLIDIGNGLKASALLN